MLMLRFIFSVASAVYTVLLQMLSFLWATEGTCLSVWTSGFVVPSCFTVAEGQGNTLGLIVIVYSDQTSTIISNKIR